MFGEWLCVALCAVSVGAVDVVTTVLPTQPDLSAKWLESFRQDLHQESYDYGSARRWAQPHPPAPAARAFPPAASLATSPAASPAASPASPRRRAFDGGGARPGRRNLDDAAEKDFGISRRDLLEHVLTDAELEAPRRIFLENLDQLGEHLKPVYKRPGNFYIQNRKQGESGELPGPRRSPQPAYVGADGVKRYRVHTDPKKRFENQFGNAKPGLPEAWGIDHPLQDSIELNDDGNKNVTHENEREEGQNKPGIEGEPQLPQESGGQREDATDGPTVGRGLDEEAEEADVSEFKQDNVRSWFLQGRRGEDQGVQGNEWGGQGGEQDNNEGGQEDVRGGRDDVEGEQDDVRGGQDVDGGGHGDERSGRGQRDDHQGGHGDKRVPRGEEQSGQGNEWDGRLDEQAGQGYEQGGQGDERSGRRDEQSGQGDGRGEQSDERSGERDQRDGQGDERGGQGDERSGRRDEQGGQGDGRGEQSDERSGERDQRGGKGDERGGQGDERGGRGDQNDGKGGQGDEQSGRGERRSGLGNKRGRQGDERGGQGDDQDDDQAWRHVVDKKVAGYVQRFNARRDEALLADEPPDS